MKTLIVYASLSMATACLVIAQTDDFSEIKRQLAEAPCLEIRFLNLIESTVFETVDSAAGLAVLNSDGRFRIELGDDIFVNDGAYLYSYSIPNNQVTIELSGQESDFSDEVGFVRKLNEYYTTRMIESNIRYALTRIESAPSNMPDSLTVTLNGDPRRLTEMRYFDINEELNRILVDTILYRQTCDSMNFVPDFPDSVERIRLY